MIHGSGWKFKQPLACRTLADRGLYLSELRPDEADLETVFLELTTDARTEPR